MSVTVRRDCSRGADNRRLFPACPIERAAAIASVRHLDTGYDALLMSGVGRDAARAHVQSAVVHTLDAWRDTGARTRGE